MWSKHYFMNALMSNRHVRQYLSRFAAPFEKDLLSQSLRPSQTIQPSQRYGNTYSRRFFSDSTEVCARLSTIVFFFFFHFKTKFCANNRFIFDFFISPSNEKPKPKKIPHTTNAWTFQNQTNKIIALGFQMCTADIVKTEQQKICFLRFERTAGVSRIPMFVVCVTFYFRISCEFVIWSGCCCISWSSNVSSFKLCQWPTQNAIHLWIFIDFYNYINTVGLLLRLLCHYLKFFSRKSTNWLIC